MTVSSRSSDRRRLFGGEAAVVADQSPDGVDQAAGERDQRLDVTFPL